MRFAQLAVLLWAVSLPAEAAGDSPREGVPNEFRQADVCARCHVVSVLEWGVSGHLAAGTDCRGCHGASAGHVANERNEIKPDRLPRGAAIAQQLCLTCHETGCPKTDRRTSCQTCHHPHALINTAQPPAGRDPKLEKLLNRWKRFQQQMAQGEQQVGQRNWQSAQAAFRAALRLVPGHQLARARLEMCLRRMSPMQPGFEAIGQHVHEATGLPKQVRVLGLEARMLLVPPGEFDLGTDEFPASRPVHTVRLAAFYLGQHEVTQAQWHSIMGDNPSAHQGPDFPQAAQMPVERVSWNDCQEFLRRLNRRVPGGGFRLPSEAEWEYACRMGAAADLATPETGKASWAQHAWYRANSLRASVEKSEFRQVDAYAPRPVGTRQASPGGFYDLQGNVSEWCSSLYRPYVYVAGDGRESLSADGLRVVRGGGFADALGALDPALRHAERVDRRLRWNGLRLARDVVSTREPAPEAAAAESPLAPRK